MVGLKIPSELFERLESLARVHATVLQQLRIHKNICKYLGFHKMVEVLHGHRETVSVQYDEIIQSILATEQNFDLQILNTLSIGQTIEEIFTSDRDMAVECHHAASDLVGAAGHHIAIKDIAYNIALAQNKFILFLDQQLQLVRQMGTQNYIATRC